MKYSLLKTLTLSFGIFTFLPLINQGSAAKPELQKFLDALAERETGIKSKKNNYKEQCKTVNTLGFTGRFQVGEPLLIDLGYYEAKKYYGHGRDNNEWEGTWTGKNGLKSYKQLKKNKNEIQEAIIMEAFVMNQKIIEKELDCDIADIRKEYPVNKKSKKYTASSILAGAHLCGPYAVIDFFKKGRTARDEYGTKIEQYMNEFRGYGDDSVSKKKIKKALEKMED